MNKEKMTEAEIIKAWKDNEYLAFGGMPVECQGWALDRRDEKIWYWNADMTTRRTIKCLSHGLYTLNPDYQPTPPPPKWHSDWVVFDIKAEAYLIPLAHGEVDKHWQDVRLSPLRANRTLADGRVLTKFGGWLYKEGVYFSGTRIDTNEIPTKIRFWAERISK